MSISRLSMSAETTSVEIEGPEVSPGKLAPAKPVAPPSSSAASPSADSAEAPAESALIAGLRAGDESAFVALLGRYGDSLVRWAGLYLPDPAEIDDVVQDTWIAVLRRIHTFEGRSSLRTWMFRILLNRIRSRQRSERRLIPFSRFQSGEGDAEPAVDPERFLPGDHPRWPGHWRQPPVGWGESPEDRLFSREVRAHIDAAIAALPSNQREVITLRDIEDWDAKEVCNVLGISASNQRVLLHRARSRVRQAIENVFTEG